MKAKPKIEVLSAHMWVNEFNDPGYESNIFVCVTCDGKRYSLCYQAGIPEYRSQSWFERKLNGWTMDRFSLNCATEDDSPMLIEHLCYKYGIDDKYESEAMIDAATVEARAPMEAQARKIAEAHAADITDAHNEDFQ